MKMGERALNDKENCQILAKYFKCLLKCENPKTNFNCVQQAVKNQNSTPPSKDEIKQIINNFKSERDYVDNSTYMHKKLGKHMLRNVLQSTIRQSRKTTRPQLAEYLGGFRKERSSAEQIM